VDRTDLTIALAGAGILTIAIAGSALTGATQTAEGLFLVGFESRDSLFSEQATAIMASGETTFDVRLDIPNTTSLTFVVRVSAFSPHVATDDILVTVKAPNGTEMTATAKPTAPVLTGTPVVATLAIEVPLGVVPADGERRATDADAALRDADTGNATAGHGTWLVAVRVTHGGPDPTARHPVALESTATSYVGRATPSAAGAK